MEEKTMIESTFDTVNLYRRGKVRDMYDLGENLLMIATDRISAFDCVLPDPIPSKGMILNLLSAFWFDLTKDILPNHFITLNVDNYPAQLNRYKEQLKNRSMMVLKTRPVEVECIVRGYLSGSAYNEYVQSGSVCGMPLPTGLRESERLPEPIFTPATKSHDGHDINISVQEMENILGKELSDVLASVSVKLYKYAEEFLDRRGIIVADTKLEFGFHNEKIILIDEVLTPDSSRFWLKESYVPGEHQESFDKQYVRDYLESLRWNKTPPAPHIPGPVISKTRDLYLEIYERITGERLDI